MGYKFKAEINKLLFVLISKTFASTYLKKLGVCDGKCFQKTSALSFKYLKDIEVHKVTNNISIDEQYNKCVINYLGENIMTELF